MTLPSYSEAVAIARKLGMWTIYGRDGLAEFGIHFMREALAVTQEQRGEWQPIESAPKDGTFVLLFRSNGEAWCPSICRWNDGRKRDCDGRRLEKGWGDEIATFHVPDCNMPTHWQPLPSPPSITTSKSHAQTDNQK